MAGLLGFGRDALQAASNTAAEAISGPVDLINMGLLGLGLPMPRQPFGGSEWMRERGLTREVADPRARFVGETLGLLTPVVAAANAPQIARGLLTLGDDFMAASSSGPALAKGQVGALNPSARQKLGELLDEFERTGPSSKGIRDAITLTPEQRTGLEAILTEQFGRPMRVPETISLKPGHGYKSRVDKDGFSVEDLMRWFAAGADDAAVPVVHRDRFAALRGRDPGTTTKRGVDVRLTVRGDALGNVHADDVIPENVYTPQDLLRKPPK